MTTLGELTDRTLRDWLASADDQPTRASLVSQIAADATSLTYNPDLLAPEEEELFAPGTLIQIGSEEILVGDVDATTNLLSDLTRGANGTNKADHAAGALIEPHPVWRRRVITDALSDAVVSLYPDLYRTVASASMSISDTAAYTEVPQAIVDDGIVAVRHFLGSTSGSSLYNEYPVELINPAPMVDSGKAVVVYGLATGATGHLVYKAKFLRPTAEADDLTADFGLQQDWEPIVVLDAVAYLIAGRELDHVTQERLSEQLEQQGYPAGTPSQIRDSLLRYRELKMNRAQDALRLEHPVTVSVRSPI